MNGLGKAIWKGDTEGPNVARLWGSDCWVYFKRLLMEVGILIQVDNPPWVWAGTISCLGTTIPISPLWIQWQCLGFMPLPTHTWCHTPYHNQPLSHQGIFPPFTCFPLVSITVVKTLINPLRRMCGCTWILVHLQILSSWHVTSQHCGCQFYVLGPKDRWRKIPYLNSMQWQRTFILQKFCVGRSQPFIKMMLSVGAHKPLLCRGIFPEGRIR